MLHTVFTRVSAREAHLILSSQTGALIRGRRSFEGGALSSKYGISQILNFIRKHSDIAIYKNLEKS